jgi:predicted SprT family Zn-dependent metalloprotease
VSIARQLDFLVQLIAPRREPEPAAVLAGAGAAGPDTVLEQQARMLLRALGCDHLASRVRVLWNPRMRSTAGTAFAAKALITLNPRLRQFGDEEVDRTLRHELAHLLAHYRAGRRRIAPHGREWQQACRDLGLVNETRCHTLPLPRRQVRARHLYRCPSCAVEIRRVRPFGRKTACLACCRRHNHGRYHDRFRFEKIAPFGA